MTTILPPQALPSLPVINHENTALYTNGAIQQESPEKASRSAHSESSGELLTMAQTNGNHAEFSTPAGSHSSVEPNGASARRANAMVGFAEGQANEAEDSDRPRNKLLRADTDMSLKRRSTSGSRGASKENWEMRHGWEDQYNSSEYLGLLSSVGLLGIRWRLALTRLRPGLLYVLHGQAP